MQARHSNSDDIRINHVLNGLRPPIAVKTLPPVRWNIMERMETLNVPGVSIAVIDNGQLSWTREIGIKEAGTDSPVTTSTLFQVASISKPVAASAVLRLVEAGELLLDEDVNRYLKSWRILENSFTSREKVTLRRILSHSAGLTVSGFPGYVPGEPLPALRKILDGEKPANSPAIMVDTTPGFLCRYSGGGFTILQQLLIDTTGESFPSLMKRLVLDPVGMTLSTYEQPLNKSRHNKAASGHDSKGMVIKGRRNTYPEMAAAGLWTTPTEMSEWILDISGALEGKPSKLLSKPMVEQMLTLQSAPPGSGIAFQFGLGLGLEGEGSSFSFAHGGSNRGFLSTFVMYPSLGKGAVVMTNADRGGTLFNEVLQSIAAEYNWPSRTQIEREAANLSTGQLDYLVGRYVAVNPPLLHNVPHACEVTREGGQLVVEMEVYSLFDKEVYPVKIEIYPRNSESFFTTGGLDIQFTRNSSGQTSAIEIVGVELSRQRT